MELYINTTRYIFAWSHKRNDQTISFNNVCNFYAIGQVEIIDTLFENSICKLETQKIFMTRKNGNLLQRYKYFDFFKLFKIIINTL